MEIEIRPARPADTAALGKLAAELVRLHHSFAPNRFIIGGEKLEEGYGGFLGRVQADPKTMVLVAQSAELGLVGYCYARFEGRDWNRLLDEHGKIHDIVVDERARRQGVARKLVGAALERLKELGAKRIIAETAYPNHASQQLFASFGFAPTMVEMTL